MTDWLRLIRYTSSVIVPRSARPCGVLLPDLLSVVIHLQGPVIQVFDGDELIKTVMRDNGKEVRKKYAARAS